MDNNNNNEFARIKLAICLVLASFVLAWGCSNMQSVRPSPYKRLSYTYKEFKKETKDNEKIVVPVNSQADTKVNTFDEIQKINTTSEQTLYESEINELHEQIIELKKELVLLRENIRNLKEKLEPTSDGQTDAIVGDVEYSSPNINNNAKDTQTKSRKRTNKQYKQNPNKSISHSSIEKGNIHTPMNIRNNKERKDIRDDESEKEFLENLNTALNNIKEKKYDIALNTLERLWQSTNDIIKQSVIDYWKGETFFLMRQYTTSLDYFLKVQNVERAPKKDKASLMIAECYTRMGRLEEAKKSYQKFIEDFPFSEFTSRAKKMIQQL